MDAGSADPIFVSVKVAADRLGLDVYDIYRLVERGELAHLPRKGRRGEKIRIYAADIPRWAQDQVTREAS